MKKEKVDVMIIYTHYNKYLCLKYITTLHTKVLEPALLSKIKREIKLYKLMHPTSLKNGFSYLMYKLHRCIKENRILKIEFHGEDNER